MTSFNKAVYLAFLGLIISLVGCDKAKEKAAQSSAIVKVESSIENVPMQKKVSESTIVDIKHLGDESGSESTFKKLNKIEIIELKKLQDPEKLTYGQAGAIFGDEGRRIVKIANNDGYYHVFQDCMIFGGAYNECSLIFYPLSNSELSNKANIISLDGESYLSGSMIDIRFVINERNDVMSILQINTKIKTFKGKSVCLLTGSKLNLNSNVSSKGAVVFDKSKFVDLGRECPTTDATVNNLNMRDKFYENIFIKLNNYFM